MKLCNTKIGLHRAQLPRFVFKKHAQLLQAGSVGIQRDMKRGQSLSTSNLLPFNSLKIKLIDTNSSGESRSRLELVTL